MPFLLHSNQLLRRKKRIFTVFLLHCACTYSDLLTRIRELHVLIHFIMKHVSSTHASLCNTVFPFSPPYSQHCKFRKIPPALVQFSDGHSIHYISFSTFHNSGQTHVVPFLMSSFDDVVRVAEIECLLHEMFKTNSNIFVNCTPLCSRVSNFVICNT